MFPRADDIIFVDNEKLFRKAVRQDGMTVYFRDMFAVEFGHCTEKGNRLLAENIARSILAYVKSSRVKT